MADAKDKANALCIVGKTLVGRSYVRGQLQITVTREPELDQSGNLIVWVAATRDGYPLELDLPFVYVNPPVHIRQGDAVKADPLAALKNIVAQTVDRF